MNPYSPENIESTVHSMRPYLKCVECGKFTQEFIERMGGGENGVTVYCLDCDRGTRMKLDLTKYQASLVMELLCPYCRQALLELGKHDAYCLHCDVHFLGEKSDVSAS